jgi:hypothetical protein
MKTAEERIEAFSHPAETKKAVWKYIPEPLKRVVIIGDAGSGGR